MADTAKQKRIRKRLEQIKDEAVSYALNPKQTDPVAAVGLAEEAAGLGLEALQEKEEE
jgi:hypothetical protein